MSVMSSAIEFQEPAGEAGNHAHGNNRIYFAVGNDVGESRANLSWAARNFWGQKICFLHVLQPSGTFPSNNERKTFHDTLKKYLRMWWDIGLEGEVEYIEMAQVEEGIVKLISQLRIKNLVMGAAAREMVFMESKIAKYVSENGSVSCQIWFAHKGHLIKTRYDQVITEANRFIKETYEESSRRDKARKESIEVVCEAKEAGKIYGEERRLRETEDALLRQKRIVEVMSTKLIAAQKERKSAVGQKSLLEDEIAQFRKEVGELKEKIVVSRELLQRYKNERDELKAERDRALRAAEELKHQAESSRSIGNSPRFFSEFSYSDIVDATSHFHPSLKIGEEGSQRIYKGVLRCTMVAIKVIFADGLEGSSEYRQEVDVLSRLRHPNIVTLIGACPEKYTIIYEYLPNGCLEDRLSCKNDSPPLPWQTRIRIVAELCSALIFLHSSKPQCIVHGHLKPSSILLDASFISKLSDFGTCYAIPPNQHLGISPAVSRRRIFPKGTFAYFDPEFRTAVEPTAQLDVYSFGIILLRLLTGKGAWGITKEAQRALDKGDLNSLLDASAGDWPYLQALQLTHLALRCTDPSRKNRPDLESEVLRVLEPIRASCRRFPLGSHIRDDQLPPYFICPIFQDVMQDPHMAADGFTYEAEAIRGWLESGHNTSPMTNVKLAHNNLTPNHALRSAIQEWLQQL